MAYSTIRNPRLPSDQHFQNNNQNELILWLRYAGHSPLMTAGSRWKFLLQIGTNRRHRVARLFFFNTSSKSPITKKSFENSQVPDRATRESIRLPCISTKCHGQVNAGFTLLWPTSAAVSRSWLHDCTSPASAKAHALPSLQTDDSAQHQSKRRDPHTSQGQTRLP
jgi:hypothetical protein